MLVIFWECGRFRWKEVVLRVGGDRIVYDDKFDFQKKTPFRNLPSETCVSDTVLVVELLSTSRFILFISYNMTVTLVMNQEYWLYVSQIVMYRSYLYLSQHRFILNNRHVSMRRRGERRRRGDRRWRKSFRSWFSGGSWYSRWYFQYYCSWLWHSSCFRYYFSWLWYGALCWDGYLKG